MTEMWNPDGEPMEAAKPEQPPSVVDFKAELYKALQISDEARRHYGIKRNEDGSYWVGDLDVVNRHDESVKGMLREFLKKYGKRPEKVVAPPITDEAGNMNPGIRKMLDGLYEKIGKPNGSAQS